MQLNQLIAAKLLSSGIYDEHKDRLVRTYADKRTLMEQSLNEFLPTFVKYSVPDGGHFFWLEFPEGFDTDRVCDNAEKKGVLMTPGSACCFCDQGRRYLRLSFVVAEEEQIAQGVRVLAESVSQFVRDNHALFGRKPYNLI